MPGLSQPAAEIHALLKTAWEQQRVLRITYRSRAVPLVVTERDIEVYSFDDRYVDGYCRLREDPRSFRIDRILHATPLKENFSIDPAIESAIASHGFANRTAGWRRERMKSVQEDDYWDGIAMERMTAPAKPAAGCLGALLAALWM